MPFGTKMCKLCGKPEVTFHGFGGAFSVFEMLGCGVFRWRGNFVLGKA